MATRDEVIRFIYEISGDKELAETATAMLDLAKAGGEADSSAAKLAEELQQLADSAGEARKIVELKAALQETGDALALAKIRTKELQKEFDNSLDPPKKLAAALQRAKDQVAALDKDFNKQSVSIQKLTGSLTKAGVDTSNLASADQQLRDRANELTRQLTQEAGSAEKAGKATKDAAKGTKDLADESARGSGNVETFNDQLGKLAKIAGAAAAAIKSVQFVGDTFEQAKAVEASLSRVKAIAEDASGSFEEFGTAIQEASRKANVSTGAAAQALAELVANGQSADDALTNLIPTLQLAKIANIDVAQAASTLDDTLGIFSLTAKDSAEAIDVLVTASRGSKDALEGIGNAITVAGPLARELGLDLKDTAGILAILAQNGFGAAKAAEGLRKVFADLQDPGSKLRQVLFTLGDSSGNFSSAIDTLAKAGQRGKDALKDLDGSVRSLLIFLIQRGPGALKDFRDGLENVSGSAEKAAGTIDDNLGGALGRFSNAVERVATALIEPTLEPLKVEVVALANAFDEFAKTQAFAEIQGAIRDFVTTSIAVIREFIATADFKQLGADIVGFAQSTRSALRSVSEGVSTVGAVFSGLGATIRTIFNGLLGVIDTFKLSFVATIRIVLEGALAAAKVLPGVSEQAVKSIEAVTEKFRATQTQLFAQVKNDFTSAGKAAVDLKDALSGAAAAAESTAASTQRAADATVHSTDAYQVLQRIVSSTRAEFDAYLASLQQGPPVLDRISNAFLQLGGGPIQDATRRLREAEQAYAELLRSGDATPEAFQRAGQAINAAARELQGLTQNSKQAGDALDSALSAVGLRKLDDLRTGAQAASASLAEVIKQQQAGAVSQQLVNQVFEVYAKRQLEVAQVSDESSKARIIAEVRAQAALAQTTDGVEELIQKYLGLGQQASSAASSAGAGLSNIANSAARASQGLADTAKEAKGAADSVEEFRVRGSSTLQGLTEAIAANRNEFSKLSEEAARTFDNILFNLSKTQVGFNTQHAGGDLLRTIADAALLTNQQLDRTRATLDATISSFEHFGEKSAAALNATADSAGDVLASLDGLKASIVAGTSEFNILGQQDLSRLLSALDVARNKVAAISEEANRAKGELSGIADQLASELDQIRGDEVAIENRRFKEQLQKIKELEQEGGAAARREAAEARAKANELHALKLKQIRERAEAEKKSREDADKREQQSTQQQGGGATSPGVQRGSPVNIDVQFNGFNQVGDADGFRQRLVRELLPEIKRVISLGGTL